MIVKIKSLEKEVYLNVQASSSEINGIYNKTTDCDTFIKELQNRNIPYEIIKPVEINF